MKVKLYSGVFLDLSRPKAFDTNMFVTGNNIENPICLMNQEVILLCYKNSF